MAYPNTSQYATISTQNSSGKLNTSISFTVCTIFFIFSIPFFSLICRPAPVLAHLHREGSYDYLYFSITTIIFFANSNDSELQFCKHSSFHCSNSTWVSSRLNTIISAIWGVAFTNSSLSVIIPLSFLPDPCYHDFVMCLGSSGYRAL